MLKSSQEKTVLPQKQNDFKIIKTVFLPIQRSAFIRINTKVVLSDKLEQHCDSGTYFGKSYLHKHFTCSWRSLFHSTVCDLLFVQKSSVISTFLSRRFIAFLRYVFRVLSWPTKFQCLLLWSQRWKLRGKWNRN